MCRSYFLANVAWHIHISKTELLAQRGYYPSIICESRGTMADDAAIMARQYAQARAALLV